MSGGEVDRNVLRAGGWAGIVAGVLVFVSLILFLVAPPPVDLGEYLASFRDNSLTITVPSNILVLAFLLILPFLAALYGSLREPSRVFARIGLGSGILAAVLAIVVFMGFQTVARLFVGIYEDAAVSDRPLVIAAYAVPVSLLQTMIGSAGILIGLAIVAFGLAMWGNAKFSAGLGWLSVLLGIVVVLFTLLVLAQVVLPVMAVFAIVLGWKVYSLVMSA